MPVWLWLALPVSLCFGLGALLGAPYLPVLGRDINTLLDLAQVKKGTIIIDLGCGDGRLLRAAARRGARAIGYEVNPIMWLTAWVMCRSYGNHVTVKFGNYWADPLPECDVVYVFLATRYMTKLDTKLSSEAKKNIRLVSYAFEVPGRAAITTSHNAYVYEYEVKP